MRTMRAPLALVVPSLLLPLLLLVVEAAAQPREQQQQLGAEPTAHDDDRAEPPTISARQNLFKPTKATPMLSEKDKLRFLFKFLADWMLALVPNAC